jgi:hypothetical protein
LTSGADAEEPAATGHQPPKIAKAPGAE